MKNKNKCYDLLIAALKEKKPYDLVCTTTFSLGGGGVKLDLPLQLHPKVIYFSGSEKEIFGIPEENCILIPFTKEQLRSSSTA
jgi:hypothetical protein